MHQYEYIGAHKSPEIFLPWRLDTRQLMDTVYDFITKGNKTPGNCGQALIYSIFPNSSAMTPRCNKHTLRNRLVKCRYG